MTDEPTVTSHGRAPIYDAAQPWQATAYPIAPGVVALSPDGVALLICLLDAYVVSERERNGGLQLSPAMRNLRNVCVSALRARSGTAEPEQGNSGAESVTTTDAAALLGVSREWVGRLARDGQLGPSWLAGGHRHLYRHELAAYAARRSPQ